MEGGPIGITTVEAAEAAKSCGLLPADFSPGVMAGPGRDVFQSLSLEARVPRETLYRAVAECRGLRFLDLAEARLDRDAMKRLPEQLGGRGLHAVVQTPGGERLLATCDPDDHGAIRSIRRACDVQGDVVLVDARLLSGLLGTREFAAGSEESVERLEQVLTEAVIRRASDIHLEPLKEGLQIRVRVDGVLRVVMTLSERERGPLISRVKVLAGLDIAEQRSPQDGGFRHALRHLGGDPVEIRVATVPTIFGERATLRLLGVGDAPATLDDLGMSGEILDRFRREIARPYGILLCTGPTGSGKTTTLYAAIGEIARPEINILTVEDPVERRIPGVAQVHVGGTDKVTFASALRSFLRHDPDVMMLGEIRDEETAAAAIKAAMTGHLLLSTLHTNTAAAAVERLLDLRCEPFQVAATLNAVIAQRLVRRVCPRCAGSREATASELRLLRVPRARVAVSKGCPRCVGTGFLGRIGVFEFLVVDDGLRAGLSRGLDASGIEAAAGDQLATLESDVRKKILSRIVTVEDGLRLLG